MKQKNSCALTSLPVGSRAKIARVGGSAAERSRLNALGLTPQTDIEVLDRHGDSQAVKVRGCSLILDGQLAEHVTCSLEAVDQPKVGE